MELSIRVETMSRYGRFFACVNIDEPLVEAFEPLKTGDDPLVAVVTGEVMPCDEKINTVVKLRENAAQDISQKLTELLMAAMKKHDTHNGYPIEEQLTER